jgi:cation transport ATPase
MSEIQVVATDKTGTLTKGFFRVVDKVFINDNKLNDICVDSMQLAASLESKSAHPLAGNISS